MKTPKSGNNSPAKTPKGAKDKQAKAQASPKGKAQNSPKGKGQETSETQPEDTSVAQKTQNSAQENPEEVVETENSSEEKKNDSKAKAPQSNGTSVTISKDVLDETSTRCQDRDRRTLFLRFPKNSQIKKTADVLKIVTTATDVRFPRHTNRGKPTVCYVEFKTEKEAEEQKTKLEGTEIGNEKLYIDYVGCKSKHFTKREERPINPLQLFIGGLVTGTTTEDLETAFPTASLWEIPKDKKKSPRKFGFVTFTNADDAQEAFKKCKEIEIRGRKVTVLYALAKEVKGEKRKAENTEVVPVKKAKVEKGGDEEASEEKMEVEKGEGAEEDATSAPKKKKKKNRRRKNKKAAAETKEEGEKEGQAAGEKAKTTEAKIVREEEGEDQDMGDDDEEEGDDVEAGGEDDAEGGDDDDAEVEDGDDDDAEVEDGDDDDAEVEDGDDDDDDDDDDDE